MPYYRYQGVRDNADDDVLLYEVVLNSEDGPPVSREALPATGPCGQTLQMVLDDLLAMSAELNMYGIMTLAELDAQIMAAVDPDDPLTWPRVDALGDSAELV